MTRTRREFNVNNDELVAELRECSSACDKLERDADFTGLTESEAGDLRKSLAGQALSPRGWELLWRMVQGVAAKHKWNGYADIDDWKLEAMAGLTYKWRRFSFDPSKSATGKPNPYSYVYTCVETMFIGFVKKHNESRDLKRKMARDAGMPMNWAEQATMDYERSLADAGLRMGPRGYVVGLHESDHDAKVRLGLPLKGGPLANNKAASSKPARKPRKHRKYKLLNMVRISMPVTIDGVKYPSMNEAMRKTGKTRGAVKQLQQAQQQGASA